MHRGYVKDWRRILEWEWYTDYKTCHLFRHCILRANIEDKQWKNQLIKKGSFVTSLENLSRETGLSVQNIRTSLKKLTSELTIKTTNRNTIISIKNYENYQGLTSNLTNNQQTTNKLLTTTKEYKNEKNENINNMFNSFYSKYPKKVAKQKAFSSFEKAIKKTTIEKIMIGLNNYIKQIELKKIDKQYIKHPATWLNQGCWEDEYEDNIKVKEYNPYYNAYAVEENYVR